MRTEKINAAIGHILWQVRWLILIPVFFSMASALYIFLMASVKVLYIFQNYSALKGVNPELNYILTNIVSAVDLYLVALVFIIFGLGIYELFIAEISGSKGTRARTLLEIKSLDDLKNKLLKVIVMALIVAFFKQMLSLEVLDILETLYFGLAILAVSVSTWILRKEER